jgi:septal ring-binding cell division protein DamX
MAASAALAEKQTSAVVDKAPASVSEAKPVVAPTKPVAKVNEDTSDAAWLKQLPSNGYVVQLAAFDTEEEVLAFKRANKLYESARILSPRKKGTTRRYFILVAGPFENKVDADAYMRTNPLLAKAWLRTSQSINTQFDRP